MDDVRRETPPQTKLTNGDPIPTDGDRPQPEPDGYAEVQLSKKRNRQRLGDDEYSTTLVDNSVYG